MKTRKGSITRFMSAYKSFKEGMSWREARKKAHSGHSYPCISLEGYPVHQRRDVVSDLIGMVNRVTHAKQNKAFFEALASAGIMVTKIANDDIQTLLSFTNEELVRTCISRGIKTDADGRFYIDHEVVKVEREYISPF